MIINKSEKAWEFGQFVGARGIGHRNYNIMFSRCNRLQLMVRATSRNHVLVREKCLLPNPQ